MPVRAATRAILESAAVNGRLAVLLSGRGSNFAAIHEAIARGELHAEIALVVSNRADAAGLERARAWGYRAVALPHRDFPTREAHEAAVAAAIEESEARIVVLAGYMRLLSAGFVDRFKGRILNIHPSLLPSFPGVDAQAQALAHGVRITGCTVHLVDEQLDGGPILVQRAVPVEDRDTVETLSARILEEEHRAYVDALKIVIGGKYRVDGRRVIVDR
ncbi:MAG TPA: phosphoribosylglycinamide formyltransferase [Thermoanaerobaculia bacterium]|nr:phosphoribosylglycinamide formyltransferase [Thermoanaerobaculia bacterium]